MCTPGVNRLAASALVCLTLACGSDSGTDPQLADFAGRYSLHTVDGSALPKVVNGRWVIELTLTLTEEGRVILRGFDFPTDGVPPGPAPPPTFKQDVDIGGSFTRSGERISFYPAPTNAYLELGTATLAGGDTLTVVANAGTLQNPDWHTYVYARE